MNTEPAMQAPPRGVKLVFTTSEARVERAWESADITIGRGQDNRVVLADRNVSRKHAKLSWSARGVCVEDIGSRYGTFLNGKRVAKSVQQALHQGDELRIGDFSVAVLGASLPEREGAERTNARLWAAEETSATVLAPVAKLPLDPPYAIVSRAPVAFDRWRLLHSVTTVGSAQGQDIVISDAGLAAAHARIEVRAGQVRVIALGGPVQLDGRAYAKTAWKRGETLRLGRAELQLLVPPAFRGEASTEVSTQRPRWRARGLALAALLLAAVLLAVLLAWRLWPRPELASPAAPVAQAELLPAPASAPVAPPSIAPSSIAPPKAAPRPVPAPLRATPEKAGQAVAEKPPVEKPAEKKPTEKSADALIDEALGMAENGQALQAIALLEKALVQGGARPRAYWNLAILYERTSNVRAAIDAYEQLLALDSSNPARSEQAKKRLAALKAKQP